MMLYHRLFRSASCMPTSRSYPRHLVTFREKIHLPPFFESFFLSCFFITSSIFFVWVISQVIARSLPGHCPVIARSLPGHCPVIARSLPSHCLGHYISHSNYLISLSYLMQTFSTNSFWLFALRFWVKERIQIKSAKELLIRDMGFKFDEIFFGIH